MLAATAMSAFAADLTPIDNLARRVVPIISDQIIFEEI